MTKDLTQLQVLWSSCGDAEVREAPQKFNDAMMRIRQILPFGEHGERAGAVVALHYCVYLRPYIRESNHSIMAYNLQNLNPTSMSTFAA